MRLFFPRELDSWIERSGLHIEAKLGLLSPDGLLYPRRWSWHVPRAGCCTRDGLLTGC